MLQPTALAMYDTIHLWLNLDFKQIEDFIEVIHTHVKDVKETFDGRTGQYSFRGKYGKFDVGVYPNGISLKGSICKHYLGSNLYTLTREQTKLAIEQMCRDLQLPIQNAKVTRIDIAENFIMQYDEKLYFKYLSKLNYYKRLEQDNGLYFRQNNKLLVFYGKVHEQKKQGETIPELFKGKHVLRYEMRYLKNIPKQLNKTIVVASDLYEPSFYETLVTNWKNEYFNIQKTKEIAINPESMKDIKSFQQQMMLEGLVSKFGTESIALDFVETQFKMGVFQNRMQPQRLKQEIKKAFALTKATFKSLIIKELDEKILNKCC